MASNYTLVDRINSHGLLLCKFEGILSADTIAPLLEDLLQIELREKKGFNRYSDLSGLDGITLTVKEVNAIAERRQREYRGPLIRSAIYTPDQLAFGMMRIYAAVVYPAPIEVSVSYTVKEAAEWVGVSEAELKF